MDPRGRTPLFLAVVLGYKEIGSVLLKHNASTQFEHVSGWNGEGFKVLNDKIRWLFSNLMTELDD